jgi:hypothetical protein
MLRGADFITITRWDRWAGNRAAPDADGPPDRCGAETLPVLLVDDMRKRAPERLAFQQLTPLISLLFRKDTAATSALAADFLGLADGGRANNSEKQRAKTAKNSGMPL